MPSASTKNPGSLNGDPAGSLLGAIGKFTLSIGALLTVTAARVAFLEWRADRKRPTTPSARLAETRPVFHLPSKVLRATFCDTPMVVARVKDSHTHAAAASARVTGCKTMHHIADVLGTSIFSEQRSKADVNNGVRGSRTYFWGKDLDQLPSEDRPLSTDIVSITDVDYYMDMPAYLSACNQPVMMYTLSPETAGASMENSSYYFDDDQHINVQVTGGGSFRHELWDWSGDNLVIRSSYSTFWARVLASVGLAETVEKLLGALRLPSLYTPGPAGRLSANPAQDSGVAMIRDVTSVWSVDRRRVSDSRYLILLTQLGRWTGRDAYEAAALGGRDLTRLKPVMDGFVRMSSQRDSECIISTAVVGDASSASTTAAVDCALRLVAGLGKHTLAIPTVSSYLKGAPVHAAPILTAYLRATEDYSVPARVSYAGPGPRRYQLTSLKSDGGLEGWSQDAGPSMAAFMRPLCSSAFCPDVTRMNILAGVAGRVTEVRAPHVEPTPFLLRVVTEFAERLVPRPHQLEPSPMDDVYDRQARPTQRRLIEEGIVTGEPTRELRVFVKGESYGDAKDPRLISMINSKDKVCYSRIMYPLSDLLKQAPWYGFGATPRQTAQRVTDACSKSKYMLLTDFSRFDGTVSDFLRALEKVITLRAFKHRHHAEIIDLLSSQYNNKASARFGVHFEQMFARASGSPETSIFNSIVNAFVAFLAMRRTRVGGSFMEADAAWEHICTKGQYGGDDGMTGDADAVIYARAAADLGLNLTVDRVEAGDPGVTFFSRQYGPSVFYGDANSCADIPRQMRKLHLGKTLTGITPMDKLVEKVRGLMLTDANTPLLGSFARAVAALVEIPDISTVDRRLANWSHRPDLPDSEQFPNDLPLGGWADAYAAASMPHFDAAGYHEWLAGCVSLDDLMACPGFEPQPEPKPVKGRTMVTDDLVITSDEESKSDDSVNQPGKRTDRARARAARGKPRGKRPGSSRRH